MGHNTKPPGPGQQPVEPHPSWHWLQQRVESESRAGQAFSRWLTNDLELLENQMSHLITVNSLRKSVRRDRR